MNALWWFSLISSIAYIQGTIWYSVPALSQETRNRPQADFHVLGARKSTISDVALYYVDPREDVFPSSACTINGALGLGQPQEGVNLRTGLTRLRT